MRGRGKARRAAAIEALDEQRVPATPDIDQLGLRGLNAARRRESQAGMLGRTLVDVVVVALKLGDPEVAVMLDDGLGPHAAEARPGAIEGNKFRIGLLAPDDPVECIGNLRPCAERKKRGRRGRRLRALRKCQTADALIARRQQKVAG
jgi:hypothetical protein